MSISAGITIGATEQITNTKLTNLVSQATISLEHTEVADNMLTSLPSTAGTIPSYSLTQSIASGHLWRADGSGGLYGAAA